MNSGIYNYGSSNEVKNGRLLMYLDDLLDTITFVEKRPCFILSATQGKFHYISNHHWLLGESTARLRAYSKGISYLQQIISIPDYERFMYYYQIIYEDIQSKSLGSFNLIHYSFVMATIHNHLLHTDYSTFKHCTVIPIICREHPPLLLYILSPTIDRIFSDLNQSSHPDLTHTRELIRHTHDRCRYRVYNMVDKKWGSEQKYPQFIHSQQQLLSYIKAGREIKWIASTLNTTSGNIRNALSRIYRKIGVLNSREALRIIENFQLISRSYSVSH